MTGEDVKLFLEILQEFLQDYVNGRCEHNTNSEFYGEIAWRFNHAKGLDKSTTHELIRGLDR